jgi:hypothetical protein
MDGESTDGHSAKDTAKKYAPGRWRAQRAFRHLVEILTFVPSLEVSSKFYHVRTIVDYMASSVDYD